MGQIGFKYDGEYQSSTAVHDRLSLPLAVSIYADHAWVQQELAEDARIAGFHSPTVSEISGLLESEYAFAGDLIVIDCQEADYSVLTALAHLDRYAARTGAMVIVFSTLNSLDSIFASFINYSPMLLVEPNWVDHLVAFGYVLTILERMQLQEISEPDHMVLLRLTEQVGLIAERLNGLSRETGAVFNFESSKQEFHGRAASNDAGEDASSGAVKRALRPALPDPRLVRQMIRQRQARAQFFDGDLFADAAWDMLLDLTAARAEHERVSVTSLCIASGVPATTALRWISQMVDQGIMERVKDDADRRRAFITLSEAAADGMARYFQALAKDREMPV